MSGSGTPELPLPPPHHVLSLPRRPTNEQMREALAAIFEFYNWLLANRVPVAQAKESVNILREAYNKRARTTDQPGFFSALKDLAKNHNTDIGTLPAEPETEA